MATATKRPQPINEIETRPPNYTKKGFTGKVVTLQANYFRLKNKPDWCLYQYSVAIAPDEDRTIVRKALLRTHRATIGAYLFDGTVLYTSNRLPQPLELNSIRQEDKEAINIKINLVGDVVRGDYHYFQLFNIIVRKSFEHLQLQLVGRNYFDAVNRIEIPAYKLDLWPGYVTSIRQHENEILMCTEISHKVMRLETLLDILIKVTRQDRKIYKKLFLEQVLGCIVLTGYNNRTYRIDDVDFNKTPEDTFQMRDGSSISYATYYKQKYQITIRDMHQPLLVSRSKARDRRAGSPELIYLIPELCRSTGITDRMRSDFQLMKALSEHTRIAPELRIQKLLSFNKRMLSKPEIQQDFNHWNFTLDNNLINLPGRVLPAESIQFANKQSIEPKNADWNFELQDNNLYKVGHLKDWIFFTPKIYIKEAKDFVQNIKTAGRKMGFLIETPRVIEITNDYPETYNNAITSLTNTSNPQLILCVVSNNQLQRYSLIKKKLCIDRPIPSQVLLARTLTSKTQSMARAIASKVAVQLNCKIGGVPWFVPITNFLPGLMVVGFDVCHDKSAGGTDFGAMVASLDTSLGRYFSAVTRHSSGEELSNDLALQLCRAIEEFRRENINRLPSRIIIYRDGVGEGQIPFVKDFEVSQIKKKLAMFYGEDKFKLAFIVVTKRINTRLFLNKKNPPPGTVVDDVITDPLKYDFFITSQTVRQGTVTPTAYNVIEDNTGIPCDKMQMLTFKLCHMYFNFSGTVRVPAPCQYAHKLSFFVSQTLHKAPHPKLEKLLYFL